MTAINHLALTLILICFSPLFVSAQAQTPRVTTVNITAESDKVRINAQGEVAEMRLEVVNESGDIVFESGAITGPQLDWKMTDAQGERVAAGTYLVTVTFRDAAGKLSKHVEQVTVAADEEASAPTPAAPSAVQATITGTGTSGKIAKFTGASTIGNSVMTESAGKIGVGTTSPGAKLDVVGAINTNVQYNIAGVRVLSVAGSANTFTGIDAGLSNTGSSNAFFGKQAGFKNTTGSYNAFFGRQAGYNNTTGDDNTFFGTSAGLSNTASGNSFFGRLAGYLNTTGENNSFFGKGAGDSNTTGYSNTFFGGEAGSANTTGLANDFFGYRAGTRSTGSLNSFFGAFAGQLTTTGSYNSFFGFSAGFRNKTGAHNTIIGNDADVSADNLVYATAIGAEAVVNTSNTIVLGRADGSDNVRVPGTLTIQTLHVAGGQPLCLNALKRVAACSQSSLRYKTAIQPFTGGLDLIRRLRPITFTWREGGMRDLGLGAEDVEAVEPLLVTRNAAGEVEGVRYDHLNVVLINAVKEQQAQLQQQRKLIEQLQAQLDQVKRAIKRKRAIRKY